MNTKYLLLLMFFTSHLQALYTFSHDPIDAVIPCHYKDIHMLPLVISGIRKNVKNINRIIVVSCKRFTQQAEWFDEKLFPFNQRLIGQAILTDRRQANQFVKKTNSRVGWIFQQLLKLYAPIVIPNISNNVLIVDADTVFLKPVEFQNAVGAALFNPGTEYNKPYFIHAEKLIPGFKKIFPEHSGISHHMLFQRCVIQDLFATIEGIHHIEPWKVFCKCIDHAYIHGSSMSEYEIYFNFAFAQSNQFEIRKLRWLNAEKYKNSFASEGYDYVSCHTWI